MGDVAAMAAILPALIPIGGEILPAMGAGKGVDCLFPHAVLVAVPPGCPAGIRAENSGLAFGKDFRGLAAVLAKDSILWGTAIQTIAAAKGSDSIIGKAKQLADFDIAVALQAKSLNLFFFMIRHSSLRFVIVLLTHPCG